MFDSHRRAGGSRHESEVRGPTALKGLYNVAPGKRGTRAALGHSRPLPPARVPGVRIRASGSRCARQLRTTPPTIHHAHSASRNSTHNRNPTRNRNRNPRQTSRSRTPRERRIDYELRLRVTITNDEIQDAPVAPPLASTSPDSCAFVFHSG